MNTASSSDLLTSHRVRRPSQYGFLTFLGPSGKWGLTAKIQEKFFYLCAAAVLSCVRKTLRLCQTQLKIFA